MLKIDELMTKEIKTVGIAGHVSPDGDCVGSCMGLYLYLKRNYPDVRADVFLEEIPQELHIIEDIDVVRTDFKTDVAQYDMFVVIDTEKERTGKAEKYFDKARIKVNIDHHVSSPGEGDYLHIRPDASSACELMCEVLDFERMDTACAMALFIGIVTDTGMFHYSSTSPQTMRMAARLMEFDFAHDEVIEHVELEKTYKQNRLIGEMLLASKLYLDDQCIFASIGWDKIQADGLKGEDMDGVVSQLNLTTGVQCAVFIHETKDHRQKVSLRSKGCVDVSGIAQSLGGGGHVRAAGCTTDGTAEEILEKILPLVEQQLAHAV